jgi:capsular polysaccharide biosynthesis protein
MEFREYWRVIARWWWIIAVLVVLVAAFSLVTYRAPQTVYAASVRFTIGINAPAQTEVTGFDPILTSYQASEYIRDDFVEVLHSDAFARDVNARLSGTGLTIGKDNISGAVEKQRRLMSMTITWGDASQAQKIAEAAAKTLEEENAKYFAQLGASGATVTIIDGPSAAPVGPGLRERLDIPIRLALALIAGLLLVFAVDYLDDTIRDARDVEALGLRVMGEIPKTRGRLEI